MTKDDSDYLKRPIMRHFWPGQNKDKVREKPVVKKNKEEAHRTCLFCKHCDMQAATQGYSEYTPESNFRLDCSKSLFDFCVDDPEKSDLKACLLTAETCKCYEYYKEVTDE